MSDIAIPQARKSMLSVCQCGTSARRDDIKRHQTWACPLRRAQGKTRLHVSCQICGSTLSRPDALQRHRKSKKCLAFRALRLVDTQTTKTPDAVASDFVAPSQSANISISSTPMEYSPFFHTQAASPEPYLHLPSLLEPTVNPSEQHLLDVVPLYTQHTHPEQWSSSPYFYGNMPFEPPLYGTYNLPDNPDITFDYFQSLDTQDQIFYTSLSADSTLPSAEGYHLDFFLPQ